MLEMLFCVSAHGPSGSPWIPEFRIARDPMSTIAWTLGFQGLSIAYRVGGWPLWMYGVKPIKIQAASCLFMLQKPVPKQRHRISNEDYKYIEHLDLYEKNDSMPEEIEELIDDYEGFFKSKSMAPVNEDLITFYEDQCIWVKGQKKARARV